MPRHYTQEQHDSINLAKPASFELQLPEDQVVTLKGQSELISISGQHFGLNSQWGGGRVGSTRLPEPYGPNDP